MVYGVWCMVYVVYGVWCMVYVVYRVWCMAARERHVHDHTKRISVCSVCSVCSTYMITPSAHTSTLLE
jgi:hypothetical protein